MPNDPNYGDLHDPEKYVAAAKRFNKIAFFSVVTCLAITLTIIAISTFRPRPEYHNFEEASGDISNLIEYHFWKTGQVAAGMKDLSPYVQAGHISYKIDFRVDWQIETAKDLSAATYAFVNYTFSNPGRTESFNSTIRLRRASNSWDYVELYDKRAGKMQLVDDPINVAHFVAHDAFSAWHDTKWLPTTWHSTRSPFDWPDGLSVRPEDFQIRRPVPRGELSFEVVMSDGTVIRYDFSKKVIEEGGDPIVTVTPP
ncbi:MAG: hypothetical protein K1X67_10780 [Fimbriimonadaceae bacterium]|nr:hypothetical protein [Fimbriimonadaceae bacterium]